MDVAEAALAPEVEEAVPSEPVVTEEPTAEPTEDEALNEIFDRLNAEPKSESEDVQEKVEDDPAPDTPEPEPEVELPHDLPVKLKEHWGALPESARDTVASAHREMAQKVASAHREISEYKPIRESLEASIKANPAIGDMSPEQIASELPQLVRAGQQLKTNPVQGILGLIQQYGVSQHIAQSLGVSAQGAAMLQENADLKDKVAKLEEAASPDKLDARVKEIFDARQAEQSVNDALRKFAETAEHWGEVEPQMPQYITAVQQIMPEGTSPEDVLKEAYSLAVTRLLPDKAKAKETSPEDVSEPDPAKVEAAKRATSINVTGKPSGKPKPMTEDEVLAAVWDRQHS